MFVLQFIVSTSALSNKKKILNVVCDAFVLFSGTSL